MQPSASRRRLLAGLAASSLASFTGRAMTAPSPLAAAFAPKGALRASINLGNPILAARGGDGKAQGVSVDLAVALAGQLGVPLELLEFEAAAQSVEAVRSGRADVGFFAIDPQRGEGIYFSPPYVTIEGAYLVKQGSALQANEEVDRAGTRVMVGRGSAYDLYLSRALKAAQIVRAPTSPAVVDAFLAEGAEVAAGVKQQLEKDAARIGGLRLLPGRFMEIQQAMGVRAGRGPEVEAVLFAFVEEEKASGRVAASLKRHGVEGAAVAGAF